MLVFDAHLDLAWNALDWNRDLRLPVADIRRSEDGMSGKGRGCNTVAFPELRRGKDTGALGGEVRTGFAGGGTWIRTFGRGSIPRRNANRPPRRNIRDRLKTVANLA